MSQVTSSGDQDLLLASGDEAGTAPEDRKFRPDVQGLRAVAVVLVVLFHSGVTVFSGGFVGVDVFFVISGFVITGVLLRERGDTGRPSILAFYGRRSRRIIPAATLVIIITVVASYHFLGVAGGIPTASDGKWAAVFLANFHFVATGTNYLSSTQPPSPLQNFWSLAVEEQFYLVYPTIFLLIATVRVLSFRVRMAIGLAAIICASLTFSIVDTASNPTAAFFSPFTRAWELALGALIAISTPWLLRVPERLAAAATWVGLAAVAFAAVTYTSQTAYPGSLVIVPVVGSALIIAGGMKAHAVGAEALLRLKPFQWFGKISYSLYLWHWPILIIAAEYAGQTSLSVKDNLCWVAVAVVASVITYRLIENPIRHAKSLRRSRVASVGLGIGLIALTLAAIGVQSAVATVPRAANTKQVEATLARATPVPLSKVLSTVAASTRIQDVPSNLVPSLEQIITNPQSYIGFPTTKSGCNPRPSKTKVRKCEFGDLQSSQTMILFGDSHAGMWFQALVHVAKREHWKLIVLFKYGCPPSASVPPPGNPRGGWAACDAFRKYAVSRIRRDPPSLLIVSSAAQYPMPNGTLYTPDQWQLSMETLLRSVASPKTKQVVIGSPAAPRYEGPTCLSRHLDDNQACSGPPNQRYMSFNDAEQRAAAATGARFISVIPWFCDKTCSFVIGNQEVYQGRDHVTLGYSFFLEGALTRALDLPKAAGSPHS